MQERKMVLDVCVEEVKGIIPILCGTGAIDPKQVREMTLQAIDCGCDASLVVTPPYIKPPQRGLVRHFLEMADMGLPVVVYNVPGRTAVDILPETIGVVAEHEMIVGVKEATGDLKRVERIRKVEEEQRQRGKIDSSRSPLLLYSGDDSTEAEFVLNGGDGCISVPANVAPKEMHDMMMAALERKEEEAMRINEMLKDIHKDIFCESNPIPAKWALKRMNKIPNAYCRPPLMELDEKYHTVVEAALAKAGLIEKS
jgi:4-hydroxy-tetrahydrodipicolinate synthase